MFLFLYNNIYFILLYTFANFFLAGIYLAIYQVELFSAILWLIECTVLFIFLLLLFYLNIKGLENYNGVHMYVNLIIIMYIVLSLFNSDITIVNNLSAVDLSYIGLIDNYYEAIYNYIMNDLFGFFLSYYLLNVVEFLLIGFILLLGSVVCVNLFQLNRTTGAQSTSNFFNIFKFFENYVDCIFLRKQNTTKQGNTKATFKVFKSK